VEAGTHQDLIKLGTSSFLAVARPGIHSETELFVILRERLLSGNRGG
jgi:hypothetical protein